jgi:hypothetical protein
MSLSDSRLGLLFFRRLRLDESELHDAIDWSRSDIRLDNESSEHVDDIETERLDLRDRFCGLAALWFSARNEAMLIFSSCCKGLGRSFHLELSLGGPLPLNIESGDGARGLAGETGSSSGDKLERDNLVHVQKRAESSSERRGESIAD